MCKRNGGMKNVDQCVFLDGLLGGGFKYSDFIFTPDPWGFMIQFDLAPYFSDGWDREQTTN